MGGNNGILRYITHAEGLMAKHGPELAVDPVIKSLLAEYRGQIEKTWRVFRETGVIDGCGQCAATSSGACCNSGVERWYDARLLLVNLLLGAKLPHQKEDPEDCIFNSPKGCVIPARFGICVNHFCPPMKKSLGKEKMAVILAQTSRELWSGWNLEQRLHARLGQKAFDCPI